MTTVATSPATALPDFAELSDALRPWHDDGALSWADDWAGVHARTATWLATHPGLPGRLRAWLRALPPAATARIAAGSRETTTHFAWRLVDEPGSPFSFWLHEYKPQREWHVGYANTVHNHRYHFCTTVLAGGYRHDWFDVRLEPVRLRLRASEQWGPGAVRALTADRFHRIPAALDGTVTFLVKSRPVRGHSVSVDPRTRRARTHVPVEERITDLADRV